MTKKKSYKVKVRSIEKSKRLAEGSDYACAPFVVSFPAANLAVKHAEDGTPWEAIDIYASPDHLQQQDNYVVVRATKGRGGLEYVGSSLNQSEPRTAKYVVGYLNREDKSLELIEPTCSSQIFGLNVHRESELQNAWRQENKVSAAESRNELLKSFGTAKAKRAIRRVERVGSDLQDSNNLFFDSGEVIKWVSDRTQTLVEEGKTEEQQLKLLETSRRQSLPPHDLKAYMPEEAYPLKDMIPSKAWSAIHSLPIIQNLRNGLVEECSPFVQEQMTTYKNMGPESIQSMDKEAFLDALSLFEVLQWVLKKRHTISGSSVTDLANSLELPVDFVQEMLPKLYSNIQSDNGRMEWVRSKPQKIGIQLYLVVLLLTIGGFSVTVSKLSGTLETAPKQVRELCKEIGCKVVGDKVTLLKNKDPNEVLESQLPKLRLKKVRAR